jgi:hypothetical protein
MNYGGSRISQMLAELVLQFSALHFLLFQERRKEAPHQKKKKKKKGKTAFQLVGRQLLVHSAWTSGAVMCYKKLM